MCKSQVYCIRVMFFHAYSQIRSHSVGLNGYNKLQTISIRIRLITFTLAVGSSPFLRMCGIWLCHKISKSVGACGMNERLR